MRAKGYKESGMTEHEACKILGVSPEAGQEAIKKRYRELMRRVHPDAGGRQEEEERQGRRHLRAQEINRAYSLLKGRAPQADGTAGRQGDGRGQGKPAERNESPAWDAPVNIHAYREREVLQYAEGHGGEVLGSFCISRGRYLWTVEEDFPLFLLSMYRCSKQILEEEDAVRPQHAARAVFGVWETDSVRDPSPSRPGLSAGLRSRVQAELAYLLAQQFIDGTALLGELAKERTEDAAGREIYFMPAMLERSGRTAAKSGEVLYPSRIQKHRLYLKNREGRELGYLSFADDRLYYVVIPMLEQRSAQVKIRAAEKPEGKRYQNLELWLRLAGKQNGGMPENLNLQIEKLLADYREQSGICK